MHVSQIKESKFLKKEDVGRAGVVLTISKLNQVDVAKQGEEAEMQYALHFEEVEKPLILKPTNAQLIGAILGIEETDNWPGHQICVYEDPSIMYAGKMVGGIRVKDPEDAPNAIRYAPQNQQPPQRLPQRAPIQQAQQPTQPPYAGYAPKGQQQPPVTNQTWPSGQPVLDDDDIPI